MTSKKMGENMKEKLYTIPVNDAVNAETECPFCFIEKKLEADALDFALGSSASYMERDIRAVTDEMGFCREHFQKMFEYGNSLGNGWILKTHYMKKREELQKAFDKNKTIKRSGGFSFSKKTEVVNPIAEFTKKEKDSCYICEQLQRNYDRYMETFVIQYMQDEAFKKKVLESKGFCMQHFGDLCLAADKKLKGEKLDQFYADMEVLMMTNFERMNDDISWFIEKFDYRNKDADWKNSKDAIQRGMQKMKGIY